MYLYNNTIDNTIFFSQTNINITKTSKKINNIFFKVVSHQDRFIVVLIDRVTYTNKMINIVNDTSKFIKLTESIRTISTRIEDKINNYLRKLKNLDLLYAETYKQLCSTGPGPGILYGLPKIHKPNFSTSFQFRPIFAAYNTSPYNLAKYFVPLLSDLTVKEYSVKNSYSFVNDIKKITNADTLFMCSFDIENLYTNVPLQETINIIMYRSYVFI